MAQLIRQDNQNDNKSQRNMNASLMFISHHLHQFFAHYAEDNQITVQQASERVDSWGMQQWKDALSSFDMQNWSDEAIQRVKSYGAMASIDKGHMITAIAILGMIGLGERNQNDLASQLSKDGKEQLRYLGNELNISNRRLNSIIDDVVNTDSGIWSKRLWTDTDSMANDVSDILGKMFKRGMNLHDLADQLNAHANFIQFKDNKNIASRLNTMDFNNRRLLRTESAKVVQQANYQSFKIAGVTKVRMVLQPGHCQLCGEIADQGPFDLEDAPDIPIHPSCRCSLLPVQYSILKRIF